MSLFILLFLLLATPAWATTSTDTFREVSMHRAAGAPGNGTPITVDYFTLATIEVTITNTATITWEETISGINFNTGSCVNANAPGTLVTTATASGIYYCNIAPLTQFRARISSFSSGTVTVLARISTLSFMEVFSASSGGAGAVGLTDAQLRATPVPVSGTFYQATQPVSGTFWQATQPVSGTVTANQGGAPWSTNMTQIGGVALAFGQAAMAASIPVVIASNQSALPVTGAFYQATQPVSAVALPLPAGAALDTSVDGLESGVGAAADAAATVGSTGSLTAKLRLLTTQLDAIQTAVQTIDNMISGAGANITQLGGTAVSMNTGVRDAGTQRVTVATNDVVPVSGTVTTTPPSNASTNVNQIVGVAPSATNPLPTRDGNGTSFFSSDTIGANVYKKVSMIQDIELSSSNSSTVNLAGGAIFTGTSNTTLGVGAIQINLFSDQSALIQVQQAQEDPGTNWNILDSWTYQANSNGNDAARTIQATGASVRVVVTNTSDTTTTVFRLTTVVCPICDTLPRGLTQAGNLKTAILEPAPTLGALPVSIARSAVPAAPVLPTGLNRLQYAAMMQSYCLKTLCPPIPGGFK